MSKWVCRYRRLVLSSSNFSFLPNSVWWECCLIQVNVLLTQCTAIWCHQRSSTAREGTKGWSLLCQFWCRPLQLFKAPIRKIFTSLLVDVIVNIAILGSSIHPKWNAINHWCLLFQSMYIIANGGSAYDWCPPDFQIEVHRHEFGGYNNHNLIYALISTTEVHHPQWKNDNQNTTRDVEDSSPFLLERQPPKLEWWLPEKLKIAAHSCERQPPKFEAEDQSLAKWSTRITSYQWVEIPVIANIVIQHQFLLFKWLLHFDSSLVLVEKTCCSASLKEGRGGLVGRDSRRECTKVICLSVFIVPFCNRDLFIATPNALIITIF